MDSGFSDNVTEMWFRGRLGNLMGRALRRVRTVPVADLRTLRAARDDGLISHEEWTDLHHVPILLRGLDDDERVLFVAMEVAFVVDEDDVMRAARRAAVVTTAGIPCLAAVAGRHVADAVLEAAIRVRVAVLKDKLLLFWPDAA